MKWHSTLDEELIKTGKGRPGLTINGAVLDHKAIQCIPDTVAICSRSKSNFEIDIPREEKRNHRVWISNPGPGLNSPHCY